MSNEDYINDDEDNPQMKVMRDWFFEHFEDPVERTPYNSDEGGYLCNFYSQWGHVIKNTHAMDSFN